MRAHGTISERDPDNGTGTIVTADGRRVFFSSDTRRAATGLDDYVQFVKKPRHQFDFINPGDGVVVEIAAHSGKHGLHAQQWAVVKPANGNGRNGHANGHGASPGMME